MSLSDSALKSSFRSTHQRSTQVIAVTSGKGGVGKTNVSANLAVAIAQQRRNVMVLDADLGLANVDVLLGLQATHTMADVIQGRVELAETLVKGPHGINIVPGTSGESEMTDLGPTERAAIIQAFSTLSPQPDVLIVDTAAGVSASVVEFVSAAHQVVVVVCDEPASITDAYAIIKIMSQEHNVRRFQLVTNMTRSTAEGRALFQKLTKVADRYLDVILTHLGNVPYDAKLRRAVQDQRAVVDIHPDCWSGRAFRDMAERIRSWPAPTAESLNGGLNFFFESLLAAEPEKGQ